MTRERALKYLKALLRINSEKTEPKDGMPFGEGISACLDCALGILRAEGFRTKNGNGFYGWGEIGEGELFGVLTHLDVVPAGGGWTMPPYGANEKNGKIYARGALDDKGPLVECAYAAKRLIDEGRKPKMRIRFILGCDEESGWRCMEEYAKNEEMPEIGISPDAEFPVINCEKGIIHCALALEKPDRVLALRAGERVNMVPDSACVALKDDEETREFCAARGIGLETKDGAIVVRAKGKSAHGSAPGDGTNALAKLFGALAGLDPFFDRAFALFRNSDGAGLGLRMRDEESGELTVNPAIARVESGAAVIELDIRHPVGFGAGDVIERLREATRIEPKILFERAALRVAADDPLVTALLGAYRRVTKSDAKPIAIGGGTYARALKKGVAFGPCFPFGEAKAHCPDECVSLEEFDLASEIYREAFKTLLF